MRFTVITIPSADDELALIWISAPDPQTVADASDAIDQMLIHRPLQVGRCSATTGSFMFLRWRSFIPSLPMTAWSAFFGTGSDHEGSLRQSWEGAASRCGTMRTQRDQDHENNNGRQQVAGGSCAGNQPGRSM